MTTANRVTNALITILLISTRTETFCILGFTIGLRKVLDPGRVLYINQKCAFLSSNHLFELQFVQRSRHLTDYTRRNFATENGDVDESHSSRKFPSIPVLGPIPSVPPLGLGAEFFLDPPTPLQWKALQESIVIHNNQIKIRNQDIPSGDDGAQNVGTIDAAPIIAFIDEVTGSR